ncbi:MAG TPA: site-specific integrase [Edaphobacter sp.]|uniref:tyrosine-type recombinase/integrase n=1 Tax=Edaphobacter sp. TaxID=1934404 RepID=UPI002C8A0902|nr:site-specific integrase [Edaphobacter sp.]HUZ93612.1 site-specific integrase [Edaphobacter sp.]
MIRFKRASDPKWSRRPAVYGSTGRVRAGIAEFKDPKTGEKSEVNIGDNFTFDIRVEKNGTTYKPAGKIAADAEALRVQIAGKLQARSDSEAAGLIVIDPDEAKKKRVRLADSFNDYVEDAFKRNALEARSQAILVSAEFLAATKTTFVDEVERETILNFDQRLRDQGREARTIFNKRQRLQSMLRWAGVDEKIFPPKPKYEMALPTIYSQAQLKALFGIANPYQKMVCNLALKFGLRDQEVQFAEFSDISWEESVFRVRGKKVRGRNGKIYKFKVKDYEQRDIPIPRDFLDELSAWKDSHPGQNLIVPSSNGNPNTKLLKMLKCMARRAKITCGHCPNCIEGLKGERGCDDFELHKFRRTCITTWLRNKVDPRTVMAYAGHADLETTLRYLRPAAAEEHIAAVSEIRWY